MSWHFSQAVVEAYSVGNCSGGKRFVRSKMIRIASLLCVNDKMTAFLRRSRSGMTCGPFTVKRGAAILTWFREGFLARTFRVPEKAQELRAQDQDYGSKWQGSFARWNPASCSWKTPQLSLAGDLTEYSETWPRWGMMRNGACWELETPLGYVGVRESGSWPRPTATMGQRGWGQTNERNENRYSEKVKANVFHEQALWGWRPRIELLEWIMSWPIGWTALKPLATDKIQQWLRSHGKS